MDKKRLGYGMIAGGTIGGILCLMAEIFLYKNRLREVTTSSFTVVGQPERVITVGIENWLSLFLLSLFILGICFFIVSIGFHLIKNNQPNRK